MQLRQAAANRFQICKATEADAADIFNLVNEAYELENGDTDLAFKKNGRYSKVSNVDWERTWIHRDAASDNLLACVTVEMQKDPESNEDVLMIGPLAVSLDCQSRGLGTSVLSFCESLAPIAQVDVVSCRRDLLPFYAKRGYAEVRRYPAEKYIPPKYLTRTGLSMISLQKKTGH